MSYDLYFWREKRPSFESPEKLSEVLAEDGPPPAEVVSWPTTDVINAFVRLFPSIENDGAQLWWPSGDDSRFNVAFTYADETHVKSIVVMCAYSLLDLPDIMNKVIDVGASLGCALYDPQAGQRYEQPK